MGCIDSTTLAGNFFFKNHLKGERFWVSSNSPGRAKVSFYGVYVYNYAKVKIFPYLKADQFNTIDVLKHLRTEFPDQEITLIWDGAPYHRAQTVKQTLEVLQINIQPLPSYSPDFMPVEHLWQWFRENQVITHAINLLLN
jgi:hypothetical protein